MQYKKSSCTNRWFWLILVFLLTAIGLIGCTTSTVDVLSDEAPEFVGEAASPMTTISISPPVTPAPPEKSVPTDTPSPIASPTPTATAIITPSPSSTATDTPMVAPTLTPLPTILPQQRGQVYYDLISSNGGCELPCWWGYEPGVTLIEHIKLFYSSLTTHITNRDFQDGRSRLTAKFVDPQIENETQVPHIFRAQDGIFTEAEIALNVQPDYQIRPILQRLGQPEEVWMWTIPKPFQGILPARFRLYFPEQGVFVIYATPGRKINDSVEICFDEPGGVSILLWDPGTWDPGGTKDIIDRANESSSIFALEGFPIEEVSNWNTEQFYAALTNPNNSECLQTFSNLWLHP